MKSLSYQNKNKSAIIGVCLVPIGILTISLCNLVPNLMKILSKDVLKRHKLFGKTKIKPFLLSEVKKAMLSSQASKEYLLYEK